MLKNCKQCQSKFEITDGDIKFYEKVSPVIGGKKFRIPPPTLCPMCRRQRRYVWRAELNLYKRKSDYSGKPIISFYPPEAECVVYSEQEWWRDDWDPLEHGRDFDFSRPFFEQFAELIKVAPQPARSVAGNENSDYVNCSSWNKNCYLLAGANFDEDCYYGNFVNYSKDCIDNNFIDHCELCYECVDCKNCFNVKYSSNSYSCSDSYFLQNCRGSNNCFGSVNLVNKQYVFFNQQLSKEEYKGRLEKLELHKRSSIERIASLFEEHRLKFPYKYMIGEQNENASGNVINTSKNTSNCFDVSDLEDCKYCGWFHKSKDCMDIYAWGFGVEKSYECMEAGDKSNQVLFCVTTYNGNNVFYGYGNRNVSNLFGCASLRHKEYCILNKQYTKEEYEELVPKIIEHMQRTGEWGEFFPIWLSPLTYNGTIAKDYFPLDKASALNLGAKWRDEQPIETPAVLPVIPDSIQDCDEKICDTILYCAETGKPYKIIPQEFRFLKKNNIPIPKYAFETRHNHRLQRRNQRKLWDRKCDKCQIDIQTSYSPEQPEIVYCQSCYLDEVY